MEAITLDAHVRDKLKKGASKRYRREGLIPSIIYGQEKNINILIDSRNFNKLYPRLTKSTVMNINVDKEQFEVLIKEYDRDAIKEDFIHIDFYELKKGKPVNFRIPLHFVGNAIGLREGGILEKHLVELEVECLPKDIISHIDVDIQELQIGETLHVSDISLDQSKYKLLSSLEEVLVHISGKVSDLAEEEAEVEGEAVAAASESKKEDES